MLADLERLLLPMTANILELRGTARDGGAPLCALYAGSGANLEFLRSYFFDQCEQQLLARRATLVRLGSALAVQAVEADLWLIERPAVWARLLPAVGTITMPAWVRQQFRLPRLIPESGRLLPRLLEKEVRRHTRQQQYTVDFVSQPEMFREFYRRYYCPYVEARFGAGAIVVPEPVFLQQCAGQVLARLHADGTWIAGLLLKQRRSVLRFGWFGLDRNPPPRGASETLDSACIRYAHEKGVRTLVMGNSRPCLADGVLRYKAKFGAEIIATRFPQTELAIEIRRATPGVMQALERQPLIGLRSGVPQVWKVVAEQGAGVSARLCPLPAAGSP
ncbi:MAG: hypothetical protein ACRES2_06290 [Steroidobacteraceae bacterium]